MKTTISTMPKSINSKKNEQHTIAAQTKVNANKRGFRPLKENSYEVLISVEQYRSHPELFQGAPGINLKLKDGRFAAVVTVIGNMCFSLDRVSDMLLGSVLSCYEKDTSSHTFLADPQKSMDVARAFKVLSVVNSVLDPFVQEQSLEKILQFDYELYRFVRDEESVEQFVSLSRLYRENPHHPEICLGDEIIDQDYLSNLIKMGRRSLVGRLDEFDLEDEDEEELYNDWAFTILMSDIMVTQLRGMGREEAIERLMDDYGCGRITLEHYFDMLTIDK